MLAEFTEQCSQSPLFSFSKTLRPPRLCFYLLDLDQQRVAIAIKRDVFHDLCVTAFLALHPELLS